jgi:hypothetical protein
MRTSFGKCPPNMHTMDCVVEFLSLIKEKFSDPPAGIVFRIDAGEVICVHDNPVWVEWALDVMPENWPTLELKTDHATMKTLEALLHNRNVNCYLDGDCMRFVGSRADHASARGFIEGYLAH